MTSQVVRRPGGVGGGPAGFAERGHRIRGLAPVGWSVVVVAVLIVGAVVVGCLVHPCHPGVAKYQALLGHARGALHGHSRIIRRSYHTPAYVRLTAVAYASWALVEQDSDATIVTRTGGVDLFPPGAAIDPSAYRSSLDACGVDHEWIDGAEVRRRFPAFGRGTAVTDDVMAIYSDETGIIPAAEATAILHRLAVEHGARLRPGVAVRALRPVGGEVDVVTDDAVVRCGSVVVCADAWTTAC